MLHLVQLEGKSVEGVVDNKGLVLRHFKGSVKADIQKCLTRIAQHIITCRATWRGMWWARRFLMQEEDDISKQEHIDIVVLTQWYQNNISSSTSVPNVDVFASKLNHVTARYATIDPNINQSEEEVHYDGMRFVYKKSDIPWVFPPIELLPKAFKSWRTSRSTKAYFCVPLCDSGAAQFASRIVAESECVKFKWDHVAVRVTPESAASQGAWRHGVYFLCKK
jgi:hypothetical protein